MRDLKERLNLERVDFSLEIFARDKRGEGINYQSEGWEEMKKAITNAQKLAIKANDAVRVAPSVMRKVMATSKLRYLCVQAKENSLTQWSATDGNGLSVGFMQNKLVA